MSVVNFNDWKIFNKIMAMMFAFIVIVFLALLFLVRPSIKEQITETKRHEIQSVVQSAVEVADYFYDLFERGVLSEQEARERAYAALASIHYQNDEYIFTYDAEGVVVSHGANPELIGRKLLDIEDVNGVKFAQEFLRIAKEEGSGFTRYHWPKKGETEPSPKLSYVEMYEPWGLIVGTGVYIDDIDDSMSALDTSVYIALAVMIAAGLLISYYIGRRLAARAGRLAYAASRVSRGDYDVAVEDESEDEIGVLASDFNEMVAAIHASIQKAEEERGRAEAMAAEAEGAQSRLEERGKTLREGAGVMIEAMNRLSDGDLTVSVPEEEGGDLRDLFGGFNRSVSRIRTMLSRVAEAAQATASSINQISASAEQLAAGAQEQSSQTTEVAGAIEEMTKTIMETTRNAGSATAASKRAGEIAREGGTVVGRTVEGMNRIAEVVQKASATVEELGAGSAKIGKPSSRSSTSIADQTNLLALNAAIEAARAGEHGQGVRRRRRRSAETRRTDNERDERDRRDDQQNSRRNLRRRRVHARGVGGSRERQRPRAKVGRIDGGNCRRLGERVGYRRSSRLRQRAAIRRRRRDRQEHRGDQQRDDGVERGRATNREDGGRLEPSRGKPAGDGRRVSTGVAAFACGVAVIRRALSRRSARAPCPIGSSPTASPLRARRR